MDKKTMPSIRQLLLILFVIFLALPGQTRCRDIGDRMIAVQAFCNGAFTKFKSVAKECSNKTLRNLEKTRNTFATKAGDLIYGEKGSLEAKNSAATLNSAKIAVHKVEKYAGTCCQKMIDKTRKECPKEVRMTYSQMLKRWEGKGRKRLQKAKMLASHNTTSDEVIRALGGEASKPKTALGTGVKNVLPFAAGGAVGRMVTWGTKGLAGLAGQVCSIGICGSAAGGVTKTPLFIEKTNNWYERQITNGVERRYFPGPGVPANAINPNRVTPYQGQEKTANGQRAIAGEKLQLADQPIELADLCRRTPPEYRDESLSYECEQEAIRCNLIYGGDCP